MSKKLEKLKEVNNTLNELLAKLETHVFVENILISKTHNDTIITGIKHFNN
jgi:hypothetical protein